MSEDNVPYAQDVKEMEAFMKGYHRDVHGTAKILSALAKSMEKHPTLRLGQLLYSVLATKYDKQTGKKDDVATFMRNFHLLLFNVYDEDLVDAINAFDGDTND